MTEKTYLLSSRKSQRYLDRPSFQNIFSKNILTVLSPEDRLDAAFKVAHAAFKKTRLTIKDVEQSVQSIRSKIYGKRK